MNQVKRFYRCSCFLTDNIFIKKLKLHVKYIDREQFFFTYEKHLKDLTKEDIENLLTEIETERNRRSQLDLDSLKRQEFISCHYKPLNKDIYEFKVIMKNLWIKVKKTIIFLD